MEQRLQGGSKLMEALRWHPLAGLAFTFLLVCGIACGISTASELGGPALLAQAGSGAPYLIAYLRLFALNAAVFFSIAVAEFFFPAIVLAVPMVILKGLVLGMAVWEPVLHISGVGVLYGVCFVLLPSAVTAAALLMGFIQAVKKREKLFGVAKLAEASQLKLLLRNGMLLFLGSILEAIAFPLALKLLPI